MMQRQIGKTQKSPHFAWQFAVTLTPINDHPVPPNTAMKHNMTSEKIARAVCVETSS